MFIGCESMHGRIQFSKAQTVELNMSVLYQNMCLIEKKNTNSNFSGISVYNRSRFSLHCLSSSCDHDALFPSVGLLLLHYDCISRTGQPGEASM